MFTFIICITPLRWKLQGCTKRTFPVCVKLGEKVTFCLFAADSRAQFFCPILTKPEKVLLVQPCILDGSFSLTLLQRGTVPLAQVQYPATSPYLALFLLLAMPTHADHLAARSNEWGNREREREAERRPIRVGRSVGSTHLQ